MELTGTEVEAHFLNHRQTLLSTVTGIVKCPHTAEDLVQETYLRVSAASKKRSIPNPGGFLFRTARNLALDKVRRGAIEARHRPAQNDDYVHAPEQSCESQQMLKSIDRALNILPPTCRQAFLLHRLDGMTHNQIATELGISASMVDKHIRRALTECRQALFTD